MTEFYHQPHNWLIHKLMWEEMRRISAQHARGTLLDVGCGRKPYRDLFRPRVSSYFGLDYPAHLAQMPKSVQLTQRPSADVYGDAHSLPIASNSTDIVLLTELLEHLPRPADAIKEVHRVLKPGGHLVLTTPLFWHLHEQPRDYYRYTKYGLKFLLETSGLTVLEAHELTGFVATFVQMGSYFIWSDIAFARPIRWSMYPMIWLMQRVAYWINKRDKSRIFSCLTIVIGRK